MKIARCLLFAFVVGVSFGFADDIELLDGRILKNAKVVDREIDSVRIEHEGGVAKVAADKLPVTLREELGMTDEQIAARKQERQKMLNDQKELAAQKAKELRDSLSESEKVPRYVKSSELFNLFSDVGGIHPIEANYLALKWNRNEAKRVGLADQEKSFGDQMAALAPQMEKINEERRLAIEKWSKISEEIAQMSQQSQDQVAQLKKQVQQLKTDLDNSTNSNTNSTIIYGPPVIYGGYPIYRPVYPIAPIPRPVPYPVPRPVIVPRAGQIIVGPGNTGISTGIIQPKTRVIAAPEHGRRIER